MKILTLNTWQERGPWRERWRLIFRALAQHRPEIAAFQEVFNPAWAKQIKRRSGYPHMAFPKKPGGLMILSRYPLRDLDCLTYKSKSPTENYLRYAMSVRISVRGQDLVFLNTHLSWKAKETRVRKKQIKELLQYISRRTGKAFAAVTGDFNAAPKTDEIKMMRRANFRDLFHEKKPHVPGLTWNNKNPFAAGSSVLMPNRRIDYIWLKAPQEAVKLWNVELILDHSRQGLYASDHAGVLAELDFLKT